MGHRASYVVIEYGVARGYNDQWGAMGLIGIFADGLEGCREWLTDHRSTDELLDDVWAEGGFLIDVDRRVAMVFGLGDSGFEGWEETLASLPEAERAEAAADEEALSRSSDEWLARIQPRWQGWQLRFVEDVSAFTAYLDEHGFELLPGESDEFGEEDDDEGLAGLLSRAESRLDLADVIPGFVTNAERRTALGGADEGESVRGSRGSFAVVLLVLPVALVIRFVTAPLRWLLRVEGRRERAAAERRGDTEKQVRDTTERLAASAADVHARFDRGLALVALGQAGHAELDFDGCVRSLEETPHPEVKLSGAYFNRGTARSMLGCRELERADKARAAELGTEAASRGGFRAALRATWMLFRHFSGW